VQIKAYRIREVLQSVATGPSVAPIRNPDKKVVNSMWEMVCGVVIENSNPDVTRRLPISILAMV